MGPPRQHYRVTCIVVDERHRRRGLAEVALRGALDLVRPTGLRNTVVRRTVAAAG